jgi:cytochrome c biogenesis protein CcdA
MTAVEITSLSLTAIGLAFAAGLLSFVSPCVLPLLPVYLSFISGVGVEDLGREHRRLLGTSLLFVAGFTVIFVLMGAGAGGIGRLLIEYRDVLMIVAGAFIAFSGLLVASPPRLLHRARRAVRARRAGVRLGERQAELGQAALPRHPGDRRRTDGRVRRAHDVRRPAATFALDAGRQSGRSLSPGRPGAAGRPAPARRGAVS